MNSLGNILDLKPNIVYPGHGNVIHNPQEKIQFYIDHRLQRERQIIQVLSDSPKVEFTPMDIVERIYTDTPKKLLNAAAYNIEHHLAKLLKEKQVAQINSCWQYRDLSKI